MYRIFTSLIITCSVVMLSVTTLQAQDTVFIRSTAHAIELGMQSDASIYSAQRRAERAKILRSTAYELPRAELTYTWGHYDGPVKNSAIELSQEIPFPTLFLKRKQLLKLQAQQADMQYELERANLELDVANICQDIRYATQRLKTLRQMDSLHAAYSELSRVRMEQDANTESEHKLFQLKHAQIQIQIEECEVELSSAYRRLMLYVGDTHPVRLLDADRSETLDIDPQTIHPDYLDSHPKLRTFALETEQSKAEAGALLAEALPAIILGYQNVSSVGEHEVSGQTVQYDIHKRLHAYTIGVSIPLDWGVQRAKVRAAKRQADAKSAELDQAKSELIMAMQDALDELRTARRQYLYYSGQALQLGTEVQQASWQAWHQGSISYMDHLHTLELANEATHGYLKSIQRLNKAVNQWNYFLKH